MKAYNQLHEMLIMVARALGEDLLKEVVFLGGCTTGLLLTDNVSKEAVRYTDDVDLITHVIGYSGWANFQTKIKARGFKESMEDNIACRMRLNGLIVDFMPDDEKILGFSNRWYTAALDNATNHDLTDELTIQLISPIFFVATKLEAYKGRGNNDPLQSNDIEDILNVFDGRPELVDEIKQGSEKIQKYISAEFSKLLEQPEFEYAVQSTAQGQADREELIFKRLEAVIL